MICTGLLITCNLLAGRYYPQIEDFYVGAIIESFHKHEPLDIGFHIMQHQAWRDGLIKTMDLMNQASLNPFGILVRDTLPNTRREKFSEEPNNIHKVDTTIKEPKLSIIDDPYNDYEWRYIDNHGWTYSTTIQSSSNDTWIYREDLGWVFSFGVEAKFFI